MTSSTLSPTVSRLDTLQRDVAEAEERARELARAHEAHDRHLGQVRMEYRQSLSEAQRLLPLFRRAHQASQLALYTGNVGVQQDAARLREHLGALIGEEELAQVEANPAYTPLALARS